MPVPDEYRRCVGYVCADLPDATMAGRTTRLPIGTAFLATTAAPAEDETGDQEENAEVDSPIFAVTARHLIDAGRRNGGEVVLRLNADGAFRDVVAPTADWIEHPTADVAVRPFEWSDGLECAVIPTAMFVNDQYVAEQPLLGSEVFFAGLFSPVPGSGRNEPIVRFGNLSLPAPVRIRFEPVPGWEIADDAFLVESRSWGGHSGSPAFARHNRILDPAGRRLVNISRPNVVLLGLVSGHYDISRNAETMGDLPGGIRVPVNAGIAVVTPAQRILDLIRQHDE
jgi:hypothetical protein